MSSIHLIYILLLILTALLSGLLAIRVTGGTRALPFFLVFTGGYLFSITIIHILPEVYLSGIPMFWIGLMVLIGFFLQQFLEFFTAGVEHGHVHNYSEGHSHGRSSVPLVVIALSLHALLEGSILTSDNMDTLVIGIILHKAPAAFALISVLRCYLSRKANLIPWLIIFSFASPAGIWMGSFVEGEWQIYLMALVAGNFLQISTTIVFENTADHKFNIKKLTFSMLGAILAILSEVYFL